MTSLNLAVAVAAPYSIVALLVYLAVGSYSADYRHEFGEDPIISLRSKVLFSILWPYYLLRYIA